MLEPLAHPLPQTTHESASRPASRPTQWSDGRPRPSTPQPATCRAPSPAPPDPYRSQSNVPVRRGVLRFRNCARPAPPWHPDKFRHALRLENRSLLLKEPGHGHPPHAHPARGCLLNLNPCPLDAQIVERLDVFIREGLFNLLVERSQVANFQVGQIAEHCHFPANLRRLAQNLRDQQAPLPVHLHDLPVIIRASQKLFLRRIERRERCQLLLDPLPFLEGIHLSNISVLTCDVKFLRIFLVDHALEFRGDFQPSLFVDARWVISAKHVPCSLLGCV